MTVSSTTDQAKAQEGSGQKQATEDTKAAEKTPEKILCPHCRRTATNGIKCQGICVADSDY